VRREPYGHGFAELLEENLLASQAAAGEEAGRIVANCGANTISCVILHLAAHLALVGYDPQDLAIDVRVTMEMATAKGRA